MLSIIVKEQPNNIFGNTFILVSPILDIPILSTHLYRSLVPAKHMLLKYKPPILLKKIHRELKRHLWRRAVFFATWKTSASATATKDRPQTQQRFWPDEDCVDHVSILINCSGWETRGLQLITLGNVVGSLHAFMYIFPFSVRTKWFIMSF